MHWQPALSVEAASYLGIPNTSPSLNAAHGMLQLRMLSLQSLVLQYGLQWLDGDTWSSNKMYH